MLFALIALTVQSRLSPCWAPPDGTVAVTNTKATFLTFFSSSISGWPCGLVESRWPISSI
jgi:hypothetical protein